MAWLFAGLKIAQVAAAAFQMVEKSKTSDKDRSKTEMAFDFFKEMIGGCQDNHALEAQKLLASGDPDIKEAFEKYAAAYVNLQNVVAKKTSQ